MEFNREVNMQVERNNLDALVVNKLPDGSTVIVDAKNETVFALNATAGAAWEACSDPTTLSGVTERMQHSLDPAITEELAEEAILRLQEQNLVKTSGTQPSRRKFIAGLGAAAALPLVVSLPVAEQRAYASKARSAPPSTTPPSSPPPSNGSGSGHGHGGIIGWLLGLLGL
jgi:hypothetical protein